MESANKNVCWGCRSPCHYLWDCPTKRRCPICGISIVKLMKVFHVQRSLGQLFYSCTTKGCRFFEWITALKPKEIDEGQSSNTVTTTAATTVVDNGEMGELTYFFNSAARIVEEKNVEVSLNITIRKDKSKEAK